MRGYFHMPYNKKYYDRFDIFKKGDNDEIGKKAEAARNELLARIRNLTTGIGIQTDGEISEATNDLDALWREYRQLHSNYTTTGQLKDAEGVAIAERLREFRNASRDLYSEKLLPDLFRHSLAAREQYLIDQGYAKGSLPYLKLRKVWIDNNTRIKINPKFYEDRQRILDAIKEIMDKLPKSIKAEADIAELNEKLLQLMNPYRDENMQPEATAMNIDNIKAIEVEIIIYNQ
jgi:polyhydroxyalkanoate synthesis regulator phasin